MFSSVGRFKGMLLRDEGLAILELLVKKK